MKILAVDDKQINNKVIELDIEDYMEDRDIEDYEFNEVGSGRDAIEFISKNHPNIVFLDIMMPNMSGLEVVKELRSLDIVQPKIIMVTALSDESIRSEAIELGADGYICKPFDNQEICDALDKFLFGSDTSVPSSSEDDFMDFDDNEEDDFMDFDGEEDDEFFDFDDDGEDALSIQKDMMNQFNNSHKNISATEFIKEYDGVSYLIDELEDIEMNVYEHIDTLFEDNLEKQKASIESTIEQYAHFLNNFNEFQELSTSLNLLSRIIDKSDFSAIDTKKKSIIASFIRTILEDLVKWKDHVFIDQTAVDVFYLNASLLNSCIQLETILKEI